MLNLNNIKLDIKKLNKKNLDITNINNDSDDLTFFNIDNEELNKTLKTLKKTYVTSTNKEETLLKLENSINKNNDDSKVTKLDSYKLYNEAINMVNNNCITSGLNTIKKALELNPKDTDILNLLGLINLLKCNFDEAFENFYISSCYNKTYITDKYVNMLSDDEFSIFLERYNHAIRFINQELYQEAIQILTNISSECKDLIEPYLLLSMLYDKVGDATKSKEFLDKLRVIDKDNDIFEPVVSNVVDTVNKEQLNESKKSNKKHIYIYTACILGILLIGQILYSNYKVKNLNNELAQKDSDLNNSKSTIEKAEEEKKKLEEDAKKTEEEKKKLEEEVKKAEATKIEVVENDEVQLFDKATKLKKQGNNKEAIEIYKKIVTDGKTAKYKSESMYQVAITSEKIKDYDTAAQYYRKYVNTYTKDYNYFDDSYYNWGMMHYNNGELEKAKEVFYSLRYEVPNSVYNNSTIDKILKEK